MIASFFMMSGWLFWLIVAAFLAAEVAATESESLGSCTAVLVGFIVLLLLFSDANPVAWAARNWFLAVIAVPIYFAAGTAWALMKWHSYLLECLEKLTDSRDQWRADYTRGGGSSKTFEEWVAYNKGIPPKASANKERIITWILFWPFSVIWSALTYPRKVAQYIYRQLITVFERMAARTFEGKFN